MKYRIISNVALSMLFMALFSSHAATAPISGEKTNLGEIARTNSSPSSMTRNRCEELAQGEVRILLNGRPKEAVQRAALMARGVNPLEPYPVSALLQDKVGLILVIPCTGMPTRHSRDELRLEPGRYVLTVNGELLDLKQQKVLLSSLFAVNLIEYTGKVKAGTGRKGAGGGRGRDRSGPNRCDDQPLNSVLMLENGKLKATRSNKELLELPIARVLKRGRHEGSKGLWLDDLLENDAQRMKLTPCQGEPVELSAREMREEAGRYYLTLNMKGGFKFYKAPRGGKSEILFRRLSSIDLITTE